MRLRKPLQWFALALPALVVGCGDSNVAGPAHHEALKAGEAPALGVVTSGSDVKAAAGPAAGFPVVIVRQGPGADRSSAAGAPVVNNLADALDRVASGGRVQVHEGVYPVSGILVDQPVTIEAAAGAAPVLDGQGQANVLAVEVPSGLVALRGLTFQNSSSHNLAIFGADNQVVVEDGTFHPPTEDVFGAGIGTFGAGANDITVRGSSFLGGNVGINSGQSGWLVEGSIFAGQATNALRLGGPDAGGIFRDNDITCGSHESCLSFIPAGVVEIRDNRVTADIASRQENLMEVFEATSARINGNEIVGTGGARDPADRSTWPIGNAIGFGQVDFVEVSGNLVDGAESGMGIGAVDELVGLDNTITNVSAGLNVLEGAVGSIRSSDVTNYNAAFNVFGTQIDLTCNWWGTAAGPQNPNAPDPSRYTPWATEPVAGTSTTTCAGGL